MIDEKSKKEIEKDQQIVESYQTPDQRNALHYYKCFVGKGNNSVMVRSLFKSRFWWLLNDKEEVEKVNFLWTSCRKNTIMTAFKCKLIRKSDE